MNTQQLEARSDAERVDIEDTIGQLRKRLSPGQLVDELLAYTKDGGGEFLTNLARQASNNPLPVSLIGAGLAWFLFSKGGASITAAPSPDRRDGHCPVDRPNSFSDATDAGRRAAGSARDSVRSMSANVPNGAGGMDDNIAAASGRISDGIDTVSGAVSSASDAVKDTLSQGASIVGESAGAVRRNASDLAMGAVTFLKDQPFVLLGAGLALGAAVGASFPPTEAENALLGESSADLKSQVKEAASDELDKVKGAGEHLYGSIRETVEDEVAHLAGGEGTNTAEAKTENLGAGSPAPSSSQ